jgi:hypothetical protein
MGGYVIEPTPAFWVSLLPVPFLLYYNLVVAKRMWELRASSRGRSVRYPGVYYRGRALGIISACFALLPAVLEWRVFVRNPYWAISYLIGGVLGVWALVLVRRGLGLELKALASRSRTKKSS